MQPVAVNRSRLQTGVLLPTGAVLVAMAVGFILVGGLLLAWEQAILGAEWSRWFALAVMYLLPHFVVGYWIGTRNGLSVESPLAAGIAPVLLLVVSLALFGGPVSTPLRAPLLTGGAIVGWTLTFAAGMVLGVRLTRNRQSS